MLGLSSSSVHPCLLALAFAWAGAPESAAQASLAFRTTLPFSSAYTSRMAADSRGHLYACSGSNLTGFFTTSVHWFQTARLDPAGNVLWMRDYRPAGGFSERAFWLDVDSADNLIVVGYALPQQFGTRDLVVLKYDPDGNLLWERRWNGGTNGNVGWRVAVDGSDAVYALASGAGAGGVLQVVKWNAQGTFQWSQGITPPGTIFNVKSLAVTPGGTVAFTGGVNSAAIFTAVRDAAGNLIWSDLYSAAVGGGQDLLFDAAGGLYVAGAGALPGTTTLSGLILRYDATGQRLWELGYNSPGGNAWDSFARLALDPSGDVVAVGQAQGLYRNWVVLKANPTGNIVWALNHDGFAFNDEIATDVKVGPDGAVYVCGSAGPAGPGGCTPAGLLSDFETRVIKWNAQGVQQWVRTVDCSGLPTTVVLDGSGAVSVTTPGEAVRFVTTLETVLTQPSGPGQPVWVAQHGLVPGHEIYALFSFETPVGGTGSGPYLGLFMADPNTLTAQLVQPLGSAPFHTLAIAETAAYGPYALPAGLRVESVSFDYTGLSLLATSPVATIDVR